MSVNFGYGGYGMMNGMGMIGNSMGANGGTYQSIAAQNSCPMCYQQGPVPYSYKTYVNPLPEVNVEASWISRFFGKIFR